MRDATRLDRWKTCGELVVNTRSARDEASLAIHASSLPRWIPVRISAGVERPMLRASEQQRERKSAQSSYVLGVEEARRRHGLA
jgi:hypothetical protein